MISGIQTREKFLFDGLFTFEVANNHQGSVEHGLRIIREAAAAARTAGVRAGVKLQFRDLDTFIHPRYRASEENRHIRRFLATRLSESEFARLLDEIRALSLVTISTPFDEPSVDLLVRLGVEIIKIGSCSAKDWPLLEKAVATGKPMIVSTGGLEIRDIDNLVSFLDHRYAHFAIMHCVTRYPTPVSKMRLDQISGLCARYPGVPIGLSSHEDPENVRVIQMAYAKGARLFERHVGVPTENVKLNAYSSTPQQLAAWLAAYQEAVSACGVLESSVDLEEVQEVRALMRGVYARRDLTAGEPLTSDAVFLAMPLLPGQLPSGQWRENMTADQAYGEADPISDQLAQAQPTKKEIIYQAIHEVKGMLNSSRVAIPMEFNVELSHHYGIERFREVGVAIIDCINREYCKKVLVQLPGQTHPNHHHRKKEETFQVLAGQLEVDVEGRHRTLYPGDVILVQRGVRHRFWTTTGAIFEEISTTHYDDDSIYEDPVINTTGREVRKTKLINWGRHQFD